MTTQALLFKLAALVAGYVAWKRFLKRETLRLRMLAEPVGFEVLRDFPTPPRMLDLNIDGFRTPLTLELAFYRRDAREAVATTLSRQKIRFMQDPELHHRPVFWISGLPVFFADCLIMARNASLRSRGGLGAGVGNRFDLEYDVTVEQDAQTELLSHEVKDLLLSSPFRAVQFRLDTMAIMGWEVTKDEINLVPFIQACEALVDGLLERGFHTGLGLQEGVVYHYGGTKADYIARADEALLGANYQVAAAYYRLAQEKGPLTDEEYLDFRRATKRADSSA